MPEAMPGPGSEATWTPWRSDAPPPLDVPSNLVHVQRLGAGAYGEVHLYEDTESKDKDKVAVKWIRDFARSPLSGKRILREVRLLSALRHENLLTLTDLLPPPHPDFDDVCIVMPYMHLDLHKVIYSKMKLSESHSQAFVCQILRGLKYMHSAGVVHRDLKPSNVLVNRDCTLRIADFGLSRGRLSEEEDLTEYVVTRYYRAVELLLVPWLYFEQVDLWSVGCIHFEILSREPLFRGKDQLDMLKNIASTLGFSAERDLDWVPEKDRRDDRFKKAKEVPRLLRLPEEPDRPLRQLLPGASEACLDLINRLLDKVPSSRITASEAIAHEYLAHLHDPAGETVASKVFDWNFDSFEPTKRELKDRMYAECARCHPHIIERDQAWLRARGYWPGDRGRAGRAGGSAEDIGPKIGAELSALAGRPRLPRDGGGAFSPEAWAPGLPAAASVAAPRPQESWPWAPNPSPATAFPTPASAQSQQSQPPATRSKACQQQPADSTSQEVDLFDLGSLLNWLEWADVALLRFTWVLHADPAVLKNRRQELPPEAFVTVDELRPRAHLIRIIALSYGWADPANPDPNGDYAEMLKMWKPNFDVPNEECCALFWDHKSLYQHRIMPEWDGQRGTFEKFVVERRTPAEERAFRRAMSGMQALYFHAKTMVLIATEVPTSGRNPRPYAERGWTAMEYAGACLTGKLKLVNLGGEVGSFDVGMVPMPIADFEDEVARRAFFRAEDAQDVIRMYQDGFEAYSRRADTLYVTISRDDPVNCQRLARALPAFVSLQQLGIRSYRYRGFSAFELHRPCELPEADPSVDPRVAALDRALDDFAAKLQVTRGGAVTVVTCEGTTYVHASHGAVFTPSF